MKRSTPLGRLSTQGARDARAAASRAAIGAAIEAAEARGWVGCGDLVQRGLRKSPAFKLLPDEQRFAFSYVVDEETGCWPWVGAMKNNGYGQFRFRRRPGNAHRVAYQILVGPIADDLTLDHLCRNKACVNPAHLDPVSLAENTRRWAVTITTCPQGHPRRYRQNECRRCANERRRDLLARETVAAIASRGRQKVKLSDDDIEAMRRMRAGGARVVDIAAQFEVTPKYASAVIAGSRKRRQRYTGPTASALRIIRSRSGGSCEFDRCGSAAEHTHHRRPRRLGGSRDAQTNLPANLVRLCPVHHAWVESNRLAALALGLLLHAGDDPCAVPVALGGGRYLLDNLGGKALYQEAA